VTGREDPTRAVQDEAEQNAARLAHAAIGDGDPTAWFEPLYAAASAGGAALPWDRRAPSRHLVQWAARRGLRGDAADGTASAPQTVGGPAIGGGDEPAAGPLARALVVGCGLGEDAEFVASLGFSTTAFDISPSAIEAARRRFPGSAVEYCVADLLAPPPAWHLGFGLVAESMTLQALPEPTRAIAIPNLAPLVAPGGTLIVLARGRPEGSPDEGPPFALTLPEIESIAHDGLRLAEVATIDDGTTDAAWRWRAEFRRASISS
jgi:SAM-dependent methyltransferase